MQVYNRKVGLKVNGCQRVLQKSHRGNSQTCKIQNRRHLAAHLAFLMVNLHISCSVSMRTNSLSQPTAARMPLGKALSPQAAECPEADDWPASSLNKLHEMKILMCYYNDDRTPLNCSFDSTEDSLYIRESFE